MSNSKVLEAGRIVADERVTHREKEYDSNAFNVLRDMQNRHFWYRGRHRFLLHQFHITLGRQRSDFRALRMIDLGGGCGGWIQYLVDHRVLPKELALGDSSLRALEYARDILPEAIRCHQVDLLRLNWKDRWDVGFLLDVLEHIPEDGEVLRQLFHSLVPGGLLFVTTPALPWFWSYNDELTQHVRRYTRHDFRRLAAASGFELLDSRYFMFFLSPLLLASRWLKNPHLEKMTAEERQRLLADTHQVPIPLVNQSLGVIFALETPLGHWVRFPWGTSILSVLKKPVE